MINAHFYYSTIRKLAVAFADVFNDIKTQNSDGEVSTVPIYMTTENKLVFRYRHPEKSKKKILLPVLGFVIDGQEYDAERQKNKLNKIYQRAGNSASTTFNRIYQPTPTNFTFALSLYAKYLDEFYQIIEQITVNFKPHINTSIKILKEDEMEIIRDVPIIMNGISYDNEFDLGAENERVLKAVMNFTVRAELFPLIASNQEEINKIVATMEQFDNNEDIRDLILE